MNLKTPGKNRNVLREAQILKYSEAELRKWRMGLTAWIIIINPHKKSSLWNLKKKAEDILSS